MLLKECGALTGTQLYDHHLIDSKSQIQERVQRPKTSQLCSITAVFSRRTGDGTLDVFPGIQYNAQSHTSAGRSHSYSMNRIDDNHCSR